MNAKDTKNAVIKITSKGKTIAWHRPVVMGILNLTPDSFWTASRHQNESQWISGTESMLQDGADIIDLGPMSTRPGSKEVSEEEERARLIPALKVIREHFPEAILSIDTYRSNIARESAALGADIINDISGGDFDQNMLTTIGELKIPYILMHHQGRPDSMQQAPQYHDIINEVKSFLEERIQKLHQLGCKEIIIDPGFGFGKNDTHNYTLLDRLNELKTLNCPLLAGISRKGMLWRTLNITAAEAGNATVIANTMALMRGAAVLRVHDVKQAVEAVKIYQQLLSTRK